MAMLRGPWHWLMGRAYLLLAMTTLMWAANAIAGRLAVGHVSPMVLTCVRWVIVIALVGIPLRHDIRAAWPVLAPRWLYLLVMGAIGLTGFNALYYLAAHYTTAVNLTMIQGSIPIVVLLGGLLLYGARITLLQIVGIVVTMVGVAIIAIQGDLATLRTLAFNIGDIFMLAACVLYAGYTIGLRSRPQAPNFVFFFAMSIGAFIASLVLLATEALAGAVLWPDGPGWALILFVSFFPSLLAQIFFMRGVELIGSGRAGLFVNLVPVFGSILAVAILGEQFRAYHALALALVLGGIWLAERRRG